MRYLKTGVANVIDVGPAVIGTTGGTLVAPTTGLTSATVDEVGVYKHGATALTSTTSSALTHRAGGIYTLSLSTAHVDTVGRLRFYLRDDSACLPVSHEFMVLPALVYDALVAGSDNLQVDLAQIGGSTQSQADLKDFADAGYDPATNKVQGVVLADTVTTLTGHTAQTADHTAGIADIPTVAEFNARTLAAASYFDPAADTVANVTTVGSVTNRVTADVDAIDGTTAPAQLLAALYNAMHYGKAAAAAAGSITLSTAATRTADFYKGSGVFVYSGPGTGQSPRLITAGTTALVQTVSPNFTTTPTTASFVAVMPYPQAVALASAFPKVDIGAIGGSTQSQADLKDFADAGYDPATNKVEGVKLADTVTALTGHTAQTGDSFARIGAAGAGLTALGGMSTGMAAAVQTQANGALVANNLDHIALTATTTLPAYGTYFGRVMHASTAAAYNQATESLEALRNRGDAAWTGGSSGANPANFASLQITTAGIVTANTTQVEGVDATNQLTAAVNASTALLKIPTTPFLAASAPANIGALSITTAGAVTAGTVSDKTGYSLSATGMNAIVPADPTGPPIWGTATAVQHIAWQSAHMINEVVETPTLMTLKGSTGDTIGTAVVTATTASVTRATFST